MGFTIGSEQDSYADADASKKDKAPKEVYREDGSVTTAAERSDFTGTLDTSDVASGPHSDLRNVSAAFDEADSNLARRLEEAGIDDNRTDDERTIERGPGDTSLIEGKGDRSEAEILESLDKGVPTDPSDGANPAEGEPGDGQDENAAKLEAGVVVVDGDPEPDADEDEDPGEGRPFDWGHRGAPEEVVKGTVPQIEAYLKDYPEATDEVLAAEQAAAKEEDREVRAGVEHAVEKHALFDSAKHNVGETKEHFEAADDDEVERVKKAEAEGQARPGIMNWTRA